MTAPYPVNSTGIAQADVELDWGPVFEADLAGKLAERVTADELNVPLSRLIVGAEAVA
ncbi:MAG: hypothetical protein ACPGXI_10955 [Mycobacterium sp.]